MATVGVKGLITVLSIVAVGRGVAGLREYNVTTLLCVFIDSTETRPMSAALFCTRTAKRSG